MNSGYNFYGSILKILYFDNTSSGSVSDLYQPSHTLSAIRLCPITAVPRKDEDTSLSQDTRIHEGEQREQCKDTC